MNLDAATSRRLVLISLIGLLGVAAYRGKLSTTDVSFQKRVWGVMVLGLILSTVSDLAPALGGPFALLVLLGSLTSGGDKAIQAFLGKIGGTGSASPAAAGPAAPAPAAPVAQAPPSATSPGPQ